MLPSPVSAKEGEILVPYCYKTVGDVFKMAMMTPGLRSSSRMVSKVRREKAMVSFVFLNHTQIDI